MLEGGLAPLPRGEDHDARGVVGRGGDLVQRGPQGPEERGQPLDLRRPVQPREDPGDHHPVLQGVADPRRGLGAVGEDHVAPIGVACEVGGGEAALVRAREADLVARAQEAGMAVDHLGRQQAVGEEPALAVEVVEHAVQQERPLHQATFEDRPLLGAQHERHGIGDPRARPEALAGGDVVGDAVLGEQSCGLGGAVVEVGLVGQGGGDGGPVVADGAVRGHHLVDGARDGGVGGRQGRPRGDAHADDSGVLIPPR